VKGKSSPVAVIPQSLSPQLAPLSQSPIATPRFGVGELPLPSFSLESSGVMPTGGIDKSIKLATAERCEKVINVGVVC